MGKVAAIGVRAITVNGYVRVKVGPGRSQYEHVAVAERVLGRSLQLGVRVHHVDGDGTNNATDNLYILQSEGEHQRLHARQRILRAGGDPFLDAWCSGCRSPLPLSAFSAYRRRGNNTTGSCLHCERLRVRAWSQRKKLAVQS